MTLDIITQDYDLADELEKSAPKGVTVTVHQKMTRSALPTPDTWIVILEFVKSQAWEVERDIFVAWLLSKTIEHKSSHIRYRGREVEKHEQVIRRVLDDGLIIGKND
jgi:hypothetical protein